MFAELTSLVPRWVLWGVGLGGVATAVVALAFYLGDRLVPTPAASAGGRGAAGDDRRRREIRTYLDAAGERFDEDHAFDGVSVPFYLPDRGVAITFDAHDYFRLEGEGVYTVLCEHEMPGRGLGRRLPFDVDEPDWATDESPGAGGGRSAGSGAGRFGARAATGRGPGASARRTRPPATTRTAGRARTGATRAAAESARPGTAGERPRPRVRPDLRGPRRLPPGSRRARRRRPPRRPRRGLRGLAPARRA